MRFITSSIVLALLAIALAGCGSNDSETQNTATTPVESKSMEVDPDLVTDSKLGQLAESKHSASGQVAACAATTRAYRCMVASDGKIVSEPRGTVSDGALAPASEAGVEEAREWANLAVAICNRSDVSAEMRAAISATSSCMTSTPG